MNATNFEAGEIPARHGAVTVYQGDAMDDFPVLRAFQQYIDTEQAKAHRRMVMVCVFFVIMLLSVIGVFTLLLANLSRRNESLNSQLIDYVMSGRGGQRPAQDAAGGEDVRAMIAESMVGFQRQLADQQARMSAEQAKLFEQQSQALDEQSRKVAEALDAREESRRQEEAAAAKRNMAEEERIKKAMAELAAEKGRLADEKKRLRDKELELYQREHYQNKSAEDAAESKPEPQKEVAGLEDLPDLPDLPALPGEGTDGDLDELLGGGGKELPDGTISYFDEEPKNDPAKESAKKQEAGKAPQGGGKPAGSGRAAFGWDFPLE